MLRRTIEFIIFSNIWISLCGVGLAISSFFLCNLELNFFFLGLVFFATLFGYNLQNLSKKTIHKERSKQIIWIQSNLINIKTLTTISFFFVIIFSFFLLNINSVLCSTPFFFFVLFYRYPILKKYNFRKIKGLKILFIAVCWSWTCCILPQLVFSLSVNWIVALLVLMYVFIITIPFDIRDTRFDQGIQTIPQMIGIQNSYILIMFMTSILFFISLFNANYKFAIFLIFTALALMPSKKKNSEFYYLFLLDGLLLVMPIFAI
jgi:hypothetical protein